MKYLLIILVALAATGCTNNAKEAETAKVRYELFTKCMEMAAKMPRQADDDVSDIVSTCDSVSLYQANHLMMNK